jgi:CRP/FNR family transcriptional regulator, cyclic AMP receptor protein
VVDAYHTIMGTIPSRKLHSGPWFAGSLLGGLDDDGRRHVLALGTPREFAAGDLVLKEGDGGPHVLVLRGLAKVTTRTGSLMWIRGPGDLIGERPPSRRGWAPATVRAVREVHARTIDRDAWRRFRRRHPTMGGPVTVKAGVAQGLVGREMIIPCWGPFYRLSLALYALVAGYGGPTLPVTQRELASLVMATEGTVNRHLAQLRRYGYVRTGRRSVTVLDASRLYNDAWMSFYR